MENDLVEFAEDVAYQFGYYCQNKGRLHITHGYLVRCSNIPFCGIKQSGFFTEEEAVEAWNRRADNER